MKTKYKVIAFIRTETEDDKGYNTLEEAQAELEQAELMQPENIYKIYKVIKEDFGTYSTIEVLEF